MLCQNCGKNEVNFRYTQIINGVKKEMALCDKCAKSMGLESLDFNMPIHFSNFLGDFFEGNDASFLPSFTKTQTLQCNHCGTSYDEFIDTGKFGCSHCYNIFADGLNNVLKNIHGASKHVGRRSRLNSIEKESMANEAEKIKNKSTKKIEDENSTTTISEKEKTKAMPKEEKIIKLNQELKQAIREERYEDAAKIRDEIKKVSQ